MDKRAGAAGSRGYQEGQAGHMFPFRRSRAAECRRAPAAFQLSDTGGYPHLGDKPAIDRVGAGRSYGGEGREESVE